MAEETATQSNQESSQTQSSEVAKQLTDDATSGAQQVQDAQGQQDASVQQPAQGQQTADAHTQSQSPATPTPAEPVPGKQAKGVHLKLTQEQIDRLLKDGSLELSDEHFTGAVRERIGQLTSRAKTAERRLAEIAAAQEEAERKALEEQERFKELYEKERQAREAERTARREDLIRSRFLLAAQVKGVVDPDVAFVIARSLPEFGGVQVDDEGTVTGVDAALEALVEQKPYLVSAQQSKPHSVGAASNPAPQSPPSPKSLAEAGDRLEQALRTGVG